MLSAQRLHAARAKRKAAASDDSSSEAEEEKIESRKHKKGYESEPETENETYYFRISNVMCTDSCTPRITEALNELPFVVSCDVRLISADSKIGGAEIVTDGSVNAKKLIAEIKKASHEGGKPFLAVEKSSWEAIEAKPSRCVMR